MTLLTDALRDRLRANAAAHHDAVRARQAEPDPAPLVKFFNPVGAAALLATELDSDGDTLFGLADLGLGCPELGSFSLREITAVRLPFGLTIERDLCFESAVSLSVWADTARRCGSLADAETSLSRLNPAAPASENQLPTPSGEGGDG